jgi:glyoxylate/hydroxypyruvate reductase A
MSALVPFVRRHEDGPHPELLDALRQSLPHHDVVELADIDPSRLDEVTVAVVDGPSEEQLAMLPNLQLVQSTWAGVETIIPSVPEHVGIARMIDPQLGETMAEAVLAWTLYIHRDMPRYARQQRAGRWIVHRPVHARDRRVGIAGLGALGTAAARRLEEQGFPVAGWSRTPRHVEGVTTFDGDDGFPSFLARSDVVVNLLPDTTATRGMFGALALATMPPGSSLINFGRGPTIDDDALLDALDSGHLDHAVLDVFTVEPLPPDHPYWTHPSVTVLPHVSGPTTVASAAVIAAANVRRYLETGELPVEALVDRHRGY